MKKKKYKYISFDFVRDSDSGKTSSWVCQNIKSGAVLGGVKWYPAWRQYCFFALDDTVFNKSCLEDINNFIDLATEEKLSKAA